MITKQKVKWSTTVKIITIAVAILLVIVEYYMMSDWQYKRDIIMLLLASLPVILLGYFVFKFPTFIELDNNCMIVYQII